MFRTGFLSIIRSLVLYDIYLLLCIQYQTPDERQKTCPKHVEFYSENEFEKLVHLFGFVIRKHANKLLLVYIHNGQVHDSATRVAIFSKVRGKIQRYFAFLSLSTFPLNSRLSVNCQQNTVLPDFLQTRQTIQHLMSGRGETGGLAGGHGNHMSFCVPFLLLRKQPAKCEIEKAFNGVTFVNTFWFRTWHGHCTHARTHTI